MLGVSTGQLLVILGACSVMMSKIGAPHLSPSLILSFRLVSFAASNSKPISAKRRESWGVLSGQFVMYQVPFIFSLIHLCLAEPSDMIKMARVAGRMTGRAVGRLMLYRRQMDDIFEQTAAKKVPC
jgi:hypothetical protein